VDLGVERVPVALAGAGPNATLWTAEQEYVFVLLIHQFNTGNLSPPELDWASVQLRAWSRKLTLEAVAPSPEGFFVDLAGKAGLVRRTGHDAGSMLRYVDTAPVADLLERAISALRQAEPTDQGPAAPINRQRIAILEKIRTALSPNLHADLRRDPAFRERRWRRRGVIAAIAASYARDASPLTIRRAHRARVCARRRVVLRPVVDEERFLPRRFRSTATSGR
jgi:hypothetical protein